MSWETFTRKAARVRLSSIWQRLFERYWEAVPDPLSLYVRPTAARRKLSSRSSSLASSSSGSQSDGSLAAASTSSSVSYASGTFIPASASALSAMCDASDYEHDLHFTDESARAKPSTSFELPPPIPLLPFSGASAFSLATHPTKRLPSDPPERQALAAWKGLVASTALDGRLGLALDASDAQQPSAIGSTISSAGVFHLPSFAAPSVAAQPHSDHTTIPAADVSSRSLLARRSKHSPMSIALPPPLTATPVETAVFAPAPSPRPLVEAEPPSLLVQTPASFAPCSSRPTAPVSAALPGRTRQNSQDATSFASTWSSGHALPGETLVTAASSYPPPSISAASPDLLRPEPCAYGFSTHSRDRDVTYTWCSLYGHSPRLPLDLPAPRPTSLAEPTHESYASSAALAAQAVCLTTGARGLFPPAPSSSLALHEASWLVAYAESHANGADA